jgi:glyoxylate reductase
MIAALFPLKGFSRRLGPRTRALLARGIDRVDARVMDRAPNLRVIADVAVGFDNVDVAEATRRGIWVTNTPDVLTETTADLTWALLLATARRIPEADRYVRQGRFKKWSLTLMQGIDVHGKTLAIVGMGRIGKAVARRAAGFGMKVTTRWDRADFISIHCPLKPQTRHLFGEREFRRMKRGAVLINAARGPIVDEAALIRALRCGRLAAAGLDVYEREPRVPAALRRMKNVVLLPHIGSSTRETRRAMLALALRNARAVLAGRPPITPVNQVAPRRAPK